VTSVRQKTKYGLLCASIGNPQLLHLAGRRILRSESQIVRSAKWKSRNWDLNAAPGSTRRSRTIADGVLGAKKLSRQHRHGRQSRAPRTRASETSEISIGS